MDLIDQVWDGTPQIDHQVGWQHQAFHQFKKTEVILKIPIGHQAHGVQVGSKNKGILIDGSILYDILTAFPDPQDLAVPGIEKLYLQIKAPSRHLGVEIIQVGVVYHVFEVRLPFIVFGQQFCECCFACADTPGPRDVHPCYFFAK
mgnify:CR=1 FL=1